MKYMIVIVAMLLAGAASAQERVFTLTLSESQLQFIAKAVGKQPYEEAAPVANAIQSQLAQQGAKAAEDADRPRRDALAEIERLRAELAKKSADQQP